MLLNIYKKVNPDPDPHWFFLGRLDPDSGGQKEYKKIEKSEGIPYFAELDILFWGLEASPVA